MSLSQNWHPSCRTQRLWEIKDGYIIYRVKNSRKRLIVYSTDKIDNAPIKMRATLNDLKEMKFVDRKNGVGWTRKFDFDKQGGDYQFLTRELKNVDPNLNFERIKRWFNRYCG